MTIALNNAALFLISTLFSIYIFILAMRFLLAWVHANYFNPLTQFIIKLTQPLVKPLRRVIPNIGTIETATLVVILIVEFLKYSLLALILGFSFNMLGIVLLIAADILGVFINIYFFAIIIQAILSWVRSGFTPLHEILFKLTAPLMAPARRFIRPINGIDISPIFVLIFLQLLLIVLVGPLRAAGQTLVLS